MRAQLRCLGLALSSTQTSSQGAAAARQAGSRHTEKQGSAEILYVSCMVASSYAGIEGHCSRHVDAKPSSALTQEVTY